MLYEHGLLRYALDEMVRSQYTGVFMSCQLYALAECFCFSQVRCPKVV